MSEARTRRLRPEPAKKRKPSPPRLVWKNFRRGLGAAVAGFVGPFTLGRLSASWKTERLRPENWESVGSGKSGVLLALWHGRMILGMADHSKRGFSVLVSRSRDGDIFVRLLKRFGYGVIRGSSSRGGASAARSMLDTLGQGTALVITPDGPRGPRHSMTLGPAWMARETGFPVLPMGYACDKAWRMKSWDRFTIPKFGARVVLTYGEPVRVAKDADEAELARATDLIRERLIAAEEQSFAHLGLERDW